MLLVFVAYPSGSLSVRFGAVTGAKMYAQKIFTNQQLKVSKINDTR